MRDLTLDLYLLLWRALRPLLFLQSPQRAHDRALALLSWIDRSDPAISLSARIHRNCFPQSISRPVEVAGVELPQPLILAAGMVKGPGFRNRAGGPGGSGKGRQSAAWLAQPAGPARPGGVRLLHALAPGGQRRHRTVARFIYAHDAQSRRVAQPRRPRRCPLSRASSGPAAKDLGTQHCHKSRRR